MSNDKSIKFGYCFCYGAEVAIFVHDDTLKYTKNKTYIFFKDDAVLITENIFNIFN